MITRAILPGAGILLIVVFCSLVFLVEKAIQSGIDESTIVWQGPCIAGGMNEDLLKLKCGGRETTTYDGAVLYRFAKGTLGQPTCRFFRNGATVCFVPKAKGAK